MQVRWPVKGRGRLEVRLDAPDAEPIAAMDIDSESFAKLYAEMKRLDGVHDVYFVFSDAGMVLDCWQMI